VAPAAPLSAAAPALPADPDAALLSAVAKGDLHALGALYDRYHRDVHAFAARLTRGGDSDLDDIVQETFVQVRRAAAGFSGRAAVRTWLLGIAANLIRAQIRREARRRSWLHRLRGDELAPVAAVRAECSRELSELARAIAELPYRLRVAFVLCAVEEVPAEQAARVLGVPVGTVWRRVHQARKQLQRALSEVAP
jgi:RNA polymerase sigma-70 factor (ECF subfamily)